MEWNLMSHTLFIWNWKRKLGFYHMFIFSYHLRLTGGQAEASSEAKRGFHAGEKLNNKEQKKRWDDYLPNVMFLWMSHSSDSSSLWWLLIMASKITALQHICILISHQVILLSLFIWFKLLTRKTSFIWLTTDLNLSIQTKSFVFYMNNLIAERPT